MYCYLQMLIFSLLFLLETVLADVTSDSAAESRQEAAVMAQTSKDDIIRLLHLFKEPRAQCQWTNLYSILSRSELDARKSSREYSESANPLEFLAEIYNDCDNFQPQNLMVQYMLLALQNGPILLHLPMSWILQTCPAKISFEAQIGSKLHGEKFGNTFIRYFSPLN
jgi:hypothetical protein